MRLMPTRPASRAGSRNTTPKNTGPSSAITQNHLLRIRSTNSRRTTAQTLCIRPRLGPRRVRPDQVDEDLVRSEEHTSELQSPCNLVCRLLLEKKKKKTTCAHRVSIDTLAAL